VVVVYCSWRFVPIILLITKGKQKKKTKNKQSISEEQLLFSPFICTEEALTCAGDFCTCTEFHNPISLSYFQIV
jgi:hypothetical protein